MNAGCFAPVHVVAPANSLVNAQPPAAVAAGNVETSQRIVDVVLGALAQALPERIPAASQGTMNNLLIGGLRSNGTPYTYYETIGGGGGASVTMDGLSGAQVHMTNTLNTPVEALEIAFPFRLERYGLRRGSGARANTGAEMGWCASIPCWRRQSSPCRASGASWRPGGWLAAHREAVAATSCF